MVVISHSGTSIKRILKYNEQKREQGSAVLLGAKGFFQGYDKLNFRQLYRRFEYLTELNRRAQVNAVHITLNFVPGEKLSKKDMVEISSFFLNEIGFGKQPVLVYQHLDAAHPHVHLVTTTIDSKGKRLVTYNLKRNRLTFIQRDIEKQFGLMPKGDFRELLPNLFETERMVHGKHPVKAGATAVVGHIWNRYAFTCLEEYNAILKDYGVLAYRGKVGGRLYHYRGLMYFLLDEMGKPQGSPVIASSLERRPTLNRLELKFVQNKDRKRQQVGKVLSKVKEVSIACQSLEEFSGKLRSTGIRLSLDWTSDQRLLGVIYVDHQEGIAVAGAELGREFGVESLAKVFDLPLAESLLLEGQKKRSEENGDQEKVQPQKELGQSSIFPLLQPKVAHRDFDPLMLRLSDTNSGPVLNYKLDKQELKIKRSGP